jgi:hypothetical protein
MMVLLSMSSMILAPTLGSAEQAAIPDWVLAGILRVETGSYYQEGGVIKYINKKRGRNGERGCFQITKKAFKQVGEQGEQFWMVEQDTDFCETIARRYLLWLYEHSAHHSWVLSVEKYNAGPSGRSPEYLQDVRDAATKDGYLANP